MVYFSFRKTTLCYISPSRALQMPLAVKVYFFVYLESVAGFKFGFKFGKCCGVLNLDLKLKLNLNWKVSLKFFFFKCFKY